MFWLVGHRPNSPPSPKHWNGSKCGGMPATGMFYPRPTPEQGKPAIVYNLRKHSEGQGGLAEQHLSRKMDNESNQANETKSTLGGRRHMFMHSRQVVPVDLRLPPLYFCVHPLNKGLPTFRLDVLRSTVTALLPWQRGARVV